MTIRIRIFLLLMMLFFCTSVKAQVEFAYLKSKDYSGLGLGGYLSFAIPVTDNGSVTGEAGVYYSGNGDYDHAVLIPFLVGYRVMLNGLNSGYGYDDNDNSSGFYLQPVAGYAIGGTDIPRTDSTGQEIVDNNGNEIDEKVSGVTAGIVFGYIFPGKYAINIGVRYEHIFVPSPDPAMNMVSLRLSHSLFPRRRN
ncbi:MAG: hypothetical protein EPN39_08480 [Chitinophagaceae bacterium]|nr:MAG: hypothetical protein EPN39_08480 [Chitinophagaceae bacterium]